MSAYTYDWGQYVYKMDGKYFCSWTCYRAYQRMQQPKPTHMEWRKNGDICGLTAKGEWGRYNIRHDIHGRFMAEYWDTANMRRLIGHFDKQRNARTACENDDDWE